MRSFCTKLILLLVLSCPAAYAQIRSNDIFKQYSQKNKEERIRNFAEMYINSIKVNPDDPRGYIDRGYKKLENSLVKESIQDFNEALQIDTNSAIAYCLKGMAYSQLNLNDSAYLCLNKAILKNRAYDWAYLERGNLFLKFNKLALAEADYLLALSFNPRAIYAYYNLGYLEMLKGNLKKSYSYYTKLVKLSPKLAEGYSRLAYVSFLQGSYATAVRNIDKAIKLDTANVDYKLQKAGCLSANKKYSDAIAGLTAMLRKDSALFEPYYQIAAIKIETGKCTEGIETLIKGCRKKKLQVKASGYEGDPMTFVENIALQLANAPKWELLYQAVCSLVQEKDNEAFVQTKEALKIDSTQAIIYKLMGYFYQKTNYPDSALAMYNRYLELEPDDAEAHELRGDVYSWLEVPYLAEKDYAEALRSGRAYLELYYKMGHTKSVLENNAGAILNMDRAIALDPAIPILYNIRGYSYSQLGEQTKAIADFNKAIQLDSNFALPYNNLGRELLEMGDTTAALDYFLKTIAIDSTLNYPYYNISLIYEGKQDYEKSAAYRIKYVRYNATGKSSPSSKAGIHNHIQTLKKETDGTSQLESAKIKLSGSGYKRMADSSEYFSRKSYSLIRADSLEESLRYINKAIRERPHYAQYQVSKFYLYTMLRDYHKAIAFLDSIHTKFPEVNTYDKKGHCYLQLGNDTLAILNFTKSIAFFPDDIRNYVEFAAYYYEKQAYPKAREIITKAYDRDSLNINVLQEAGIIFTVTKEYGLAIKAYTKVLLMDKNSSLAYGNMGWVKYLQGKYNECIELSKKAIALDEEAFYAKYNLALSLLCLKKHNESIAYYKQTYAEQKEMYKTPDLNGTFTDLIDLIKANKFVKESRHVLKTVFGLTDVKIDDLIKG